VIQNDPNRRPSVESAWPRYVTSAYHQSERLTARAAPRATGTSAAPTSTATGARASRRRVRTRYRAAAAPASKPDCFSDIAQPASTPLANSHQGLRFWNRYAHAAATPVAAMAPASSSPLAMKPSMRAFEDATAPARTQRGRSPPGEQRTRCTPRRPPRCSRTRWPSRVWPQGATGQVIPTTEQQQQALRSIDPSVRVERLARRPGPGYRQVPTSSEVSGVVRNRSRRTMDTTIDAATKRVGNRSTGHGVERGVQPFGRGFDKERHWSTIRRQPSGTLAVLGRR
jgi:hypothetical protein